MNWILLKEASFGNQQKIGKEKKKKKPFQAEPTWTAHKRPKGGGSSRAQLRDPSTVTRFTQTRRGGPEPGWVSAARAGLGRRARPAAAAAASRDLPDRPGGAVSRDCSALAPRAAPEVAEIPGHSPVPSLVSGVRWAARGRKRRLLSTAARVIDPELIFRKKSFLQNGKIIK